MASAHRQHDCIEIVFAKFLEIARYVGKGSRGQRHRAKLSGPARFLDALQRATMPCPPLQKQDTPPAEMLAHSLIAFAAEPPQRLRNALELEEAFRPEPDRAWRENECGAFWKLASLIQDVWEHLQDRVRTVDDVIDSALANLAEPPVCDFGAGAGRFALPLARAGIDVSCIEPNWVKRLFLRSLARREGPQGRLRIGLAHKRYGTVVAMDVLDHLAAPHHAVEAIAHRLLPGGRMLYRAGFREDGWHQGSGATLDAVYACLRTHFTPFDRWDGSPHVMTLRKNATPDQAATPTVRWPLDGDLSLKLDAATLIAAHPHDAGTYVVSSALIPSRPLHLSSEGHTLLELLCTGQPIAAIRHWGNQQHIDAEELNDSLGHLLDCGLICSRHD
jgi:SAM-dependent methyltransferase